MSQVEKQAADAGDSDDEAEQNEPAKNQTRSYLEAGTVYNANHAIKGKDKKENWMRIQRTTFTNWINDRLKGNPQVFELEVNLQDGVALAKLMEVLSGLKVKGINKAPKVKAHIIDNLSQVFKILEAERIKLVSITPEAISQGKLTLIMGLIWTLILKYQIKFKPTAHVSAKKAMIIWLNTMIPMTNIKNLTTDWQSGFALLSLIDTIKPGIVPALSTLDPANGFNNCTLAMKIAKNHLKIPQVLNAEDVSSLSIDEISMMTYLSYFCNPAANKLLKWVQKMIPHMNVKNLTTDWNNGLVLAALLEARFPGVFPDANQLRPQEAYQNLERCLAICADQMGLETPLKIKDLMEPGLEELLMMSFLASIKNGGLVALPNELEATGPGLESAAVGKQTHFMVDCTCGGPGKLSIDVYNASIGKQVKHVMHESKPGMHTVKYQPDDPGELSIDILWSGNPMPNSPFRVAVTDAAQLKILNLSDHATTVNINQPISLDLDGSNVGKGSLKAYYQYEDTEEAMTTDIQENFDQTYTLKYEFARSGIASLHVFWNGEELTHCKVQYIIVNSEDYSLIDPPVEQMFHTMYPVKFQVQGESENSLMLLTMLGVTENITMPITMQSIEGNIGTASYVPTIPGEYTIEASCANRHIFGSPFTIYVVDSSQCFLANTLPKTLAIGVAHEFQLETKEAGPGGANFDIEEKDINQVFQVSAEEEESMIIFRVTPLLVGEYLASLKWSNQHITCSPFRLAVCDPKQCKLQPDLSEIKSIPVGKPVQFIIGTKKAGYSPHIKPVVKAQGITAVYTAEIESLDKYDYSVNFVPWEIGKLEINVTYGGYPVTGSPFTLQVLGFHSGMCTAQGEGLQRALTTVPAQFVVVADQPRLLVEGFLVIKVTSVMKKMECKVRARDNDDGTYNIAYLAQQVGAYLISITVHGDHIPGSPFKMNTLHGPDHSKCIAYGPALEQTTILCVGKPIDFSVDTRNAGTGEMSVKAIGPGGAVASVYTSKNEAPGVYDIRLDPVRHGKYRTSIKWANKHIPDSPFMLKIFPGVDPTKCKAYGPGLEDRTVGEVTYFIIETKNAGAGTLRVRLHGASDAFNIEISPKDPQDVRTLEAKYTPPRNGEYLITIKWDDINIPGSPFKVMVTGGEESQDDFTHRPTPRSLSDTGFEVDVDMDDDSEEEFEEEAKRHAAKRKMSKSMSDTGFTREENVTREEMPDFGSMGKKDYKKNFISTDGGVKIRSDTTTSHGPQMSRSMSPTYMNQMYGPQGRMMMRPTMMAPQMQVRPVAVQQVRRVKHRRQ